jgi:hypothetical protein
MSRLLQLKPERLVRGSRKGDSKMKTLSRGVLAAALMLTSASVIHAQDLSKYRNFSFGSSVASVSKQVGRQPVEAQTIHQQPALIQELAWYPPMAFDSSRPAEPVEKVIFSFYNGALYRMLVAYDRSSTKGLTDEDMIRVVSAKYGVATRPAARVDFPMNPSYDATARVIARWEDSEYSLNLIRSSRSDIFALLMFDKGLDAQAAVSIAESVELERQEAPQKEAERAKKEADDLEVDRQKNIKTLRP